MKIGSLAPWFGSKRTLAPEIVRQLGPHSSYWEPFCGSMAVLLAKPEVSQETVNDLHGDLINMARVIRDPRWGPWIYRRLRRLWVHEGNFQESAEVLKAAEFSAAEGLALGCREAARAYHFFVASWLGRNGVIGTKQWNNNFCVRYTRNGGIQGTRFVSTVNSIPAWRRRLKEVTILQRDGFALLDRIEDQEATAIYCDPPYLVETRSPNAGRSRRSGSAKYVHDFEGPDHERLAQVLARFRKARVVVSYYDHPTLADLYPGWAVVKYPVAKGLAVQGKRGSKSETAPEVLIINGEPIIDIGEPGSLFD